MAQSIYRIQAGDTIAKVTALTGLSEQNLRAQGVLGLDAHGQKVLFPRNLEGRPNEILYTPRDDGGASLRRSGPARLSADPVRFESGDAVEIGRLDLGQGRFLSLADATVVGYNPETNTYTVSVPPSTQYGFYEKSGRGIAASFTLRSEKSFEVPARDVSARPDATTMRAQIEAAKAAKRMLPNPILEEMGFMHVANLNALDNIVID